MLQTRTPLPPKLKIEIEIDNDLKLNDLGFVKLPFFVRMIFGIVQTERMIYSGALFHELNASSWISRYVANGHQTMRQGWTTWTRR